MSLKMWFFRPRKYKSMNERKVSQVLVVDDEVAVRDFLRRFLNYEGIETHTVASGYQAIELAGKEHFDIIFVEIKMPGMDGLQTYRELKKLIPQALYVMMSGDYTDSRLEDAKIEGAYSCMKKPFDIEEIRALIKSFVLK